jgi:sec-independent protein translocase protein TatA
MGNIGFTELLIIAVIVLLLFGAKRLPEIGGSIGKGIREFKRSLSDVDSQLPPNGQQNSQLGQGSRQYEAPPTEPPAQGGPKRLSQ